MKIKTLLILLTAVFIQKQLFAAPPTWSVNPASYQYSMTVTAVANVNCVELTNPSNRLGAFVGGVCRGTALTSSVINGKYIASMVVYSNVTTGENIQFKIYNTQTDSVYDAVVTAAFQDNASYGVSTSPFEIKSNFAPTAIQLSNNTIPETTPIGGAVGNFSSTDADLGQTHTYTLVSGMGSIDNAKFSITSGQLKTAAILNYSASSNYSIRVRTTDNFGCTYEQTFTIYVTDVNTPPTQILLSDTAVNENSVTNTLIGTFSAVDNDNGDTHSYNLVSGTGSTDNNAFSISGNTLRSFGNYNFEVKATYSIRVRVTDGANNTFERVFLIAIRDINDAPTNILVNNNTIGVSFMENKPIGAVIGTLTTVDEDVNNAHAYSFVNSSGNNNEFFSIIGNQLRTNSNFDYETRQNYVIFVQTNDGNGGIFTKQFLLTVTDSNDVPTAINLTNSAIQENLAANTFIAKLSATDPDALGNYTYMLVSGSGSGGNSSFAVRNDSLFSNAIFDFETVNTYSIRLQVNDGYGGILQQIFSINVLNVNDTPTNIILTSNQIQENSSINTVIGSFSSLDQDVSNTFTYALIAGTGSTDNAAFNISGNNLRSSNVFDFETKNSYSIRVRTTDNGGLFFEKVFTIEVTDVTDVPTNITISNDTINENMAANTLIGTFNTVTQDANVTYTYSFDNSNPVNDNASFVINGNQLRSSTSFDYEAKNTYNIYVKTSSGNVSYTKLIQVFVRNQNDAPTDIALSINTIKENKPAGSFIGTFTSTDADMGNTFTYALVSGAGSADNGYFSISNDSLYTTAVLDFEVKNTFNIRVQTTDNAMGQFSKAFTIIVNDSNDAPTGLFLTASAIQENLSIGTAIATLSTADVDAGQTFTYSLVGGVGSTHNSAFYVQGNQLRSNMVFDFEQQNTYKIRLQTNDGNGGTFADTFSIYVLNQNDAPTNINLSNSVITENRNINSVVGTFTTVDQDQSDVFVYSFANITGNDNAAFFINGDQLRTNISFNYEAKQVYNIYVQTYDGALSYTKHFLITVADSNDAPTNISLANNTINENASINTYITTMNTDDIDANQSFTYALTTGLGSTNNASFRISNDTLYSNAVFNFEAKASYTIRIKTTDNGGLAFEKQFDININNINDDPTNIQLSANEITENKASRTYIGMFNTTDQDVANTFTYSLVNGQGDTNNTAFVIIGNELKSNRIFNYEQQSTFSIRVQTNDGNGGMFEKVFLIYVVDSNDAPSNILLSNTLIAENRPVGSKLCDISTSDQDVGDNFIYSFANVQGNDNSHFFIVGNEIRTNTVFDYETKNFYIIVLTTTDALGSSYTKQFVINIKDSVDAPVALDLGSNAIDENEPAATYIGTFTATDADQTTGFVFTLVPGAGSKDNSQFSIADDSLLSAASFDFETKKIYNIRVRVTDITGAFYEKAFVVNINDANDAPTQLGLSANLLAENASVLTEIGVFTTTDADANDMFKYSLVAGVGSTDNALFILEDNKLRSNFVANYEAKNNYSIRIATQDKGGIILEAVFVINIVDVSEKPSIAPQTFTVEENTPYGTKFGTVTAQSQDAGANLTFSILGTNAYFAIDEQTGDLQTITGLDYEKNRKFTFNVVVKDNQNKPLYDTALITVNITDAIESKQTLPANNYMSPNNDGYNDFFVVENVEMYADYTLTIYNENGMQVYFNTNQYQNNWDGSYNGNMLPAGVYFYVFKNAKTNTTFKGSINLIR